MTIGIAFLQTLGGARLKPTTGSHPALPATKALTASEFRRAGRLLSLMVQHVQTLDLAELRKSELTAAGQAVVGLEREQTRLREALQRHLPAPEPLTRRSRPQTHTEQVVQRLLETVSHDYAQPLTLRGCAAKLGMNAAYLSTLFSRAVGRPFKTFLTEFRMKNAKSLLGDPAQTVSGVAGAVGYGSENQFRLAFKKATGLAPKLWRQALRTQPLAVTLWLLDELEILESAGLACVG